MGAAVPQLAVLLIHHARKGRDAFRGSSSIEDQLSVVWEMSADAHDEDVRRLHCEKIRVDEKPADGWVRVRRDGKKVSVVATEKPTGAPVKGAGALHRDRGSARLLQRRANDARRNS